MIIAIKVCIWFLNLIFLYQSVEFVEICYYDLNYPEKLVNVLFSAGVNFIPDTFKLSIHTEDEFYQTQRGNYKNEYWLFTSNVEDYILKKSDSQCTDFIEYVVPWTSEFINRINLTFSWGSENFLLDLASLLVESDFEPSVHTVSGLKGNIKIKIGLKSENFTQSSFRSPVSFPPKEWNKEVRSLHPGETYCLDFFTTQITEKLVFRSAPGYAIQPLKYYIFSFVGLRSPHGKVIDIQTYLGRVYPCPLSIDANEHLKMFVNAATKVVEIRISEKSHGYENMIRYVHSGINFEEISNDMLFDFYLLDIISTRITQKMIDERVGLLLDFHVFINEHCVMNIPKHLEIFMSRIMIDINHSYAVFCEKLLMVDMSKAHLKVYKIRWASVMEIQKCRTEEKNYIERYSNM